MDPIKDAFSKVKQDMDTMKEEISNLQSQISELTRSIQHITASQQTNQRENPTHDLTELSKHSLNAVKSPFSSVSTGNRGVPTNQPTNQQTNQRTGNEGVSSIKNPLNRLAHVSDVLESLDELKREVRIKFKRLTAQEMLVFSTIYQLDESGIDVDYALIAQHLNLTEISIRDYVRKIVTKGIPVEKLKIGNKKIILSISKDLKQVASLATILQLRDL